MKAFFSKKDKPIFQSSYLNLNFLRHFLTYLRSKINLLFPLRCIDTESGLITVSGVSTSTIRSVFINSRMASSTKLVLLIVDLLFLKTFWQGRVINHNLYTLRMMLSTKFDAPISTQNCILSLSFPLTLMGLSLLEYSYLSFTSNRSIMKFSLLFRLCE